ncbi:four helix bundle protein [Candidatus Peregrinibacteria bacterium]|nr:four helix bundle protein [Candidatus Peregrinibacteria bacterium]
MDVNLKRDRMVYFMNEFRLYRGGFRKLVAWQEAHRLSLFVYELTAQFPEREKYGVTDQMRRAANSVGANIAEGSSRRTVKDQNSFYINARSSLVEVDNFAELVHDLKYINDDQYRQLLEKINKVGYLIFRLLNRNSQPIPPKKLIPQ